MASSLRLLGGVKKKEDVIGCYLKLPSLFAFFTRGRSVDESVEILVGLVRRREVVVCALQSAVLVYF